jgi:phage-related protein
MMRKVQISQECLKFIEESSYRVQEKFEYLLTIVSEQKIIHKAIAEKLVNTEYYELKIKAENQYRVILFTIDHTNINQSENIILLNCFLKRTNKDYKKAVKIADKLLDKYRENEE